MKCKQPGTGTDWIGLMDLLSNYYELTF